MRIADRIITYAEQADCIARMRTGRFRAADLTAVLVAAGVEIHAYRAADHLIRREKKAGHIRLVKQGPYREPV